MRKSDRDTILLMRRRLAEISAKSHSPALLEVDECIHVLEKQDIEKVAAAQKAIKDSEVGKNNFRAAFHKKVSIFKFHCVIKLIIVCEI